MAINFNPLDVLSGFNLTKLNQNFQNIKTALTDGLSRSGNGSNQMEADIDLNSNDLLNVNSIDANVLILDGEVVQKVDLAGALKASKALSEIAALGLQSTARTNLGLGDSATRNVGTIVGTVPDGADRRFAEDIVAQSGKTMPPETGWLQRYLHITGDSLNAESVNPIARGLRIAHEVGGATLTGGRIATEVSMIHTAPDSPTNGVKEFVALTGSAYGFANGGFGGTVPSPKGALFGGNSIVTTVNGYTNTVNITSHEFNTQMETGSSTFYKSGIQIASRDQVFASGPDAGVAISAVSGAVGYKHGILFGDMNGGSPVPFNGTLIGTFTSLGPVLPAATGIDFTAYGFSDSIMKSAGMSIAAGGNVRAGLLNGAAQVQYDFQTGGFGNAFDARIAASGGTNGINGTGIIDVFSGIFRINGRLEPKNVAGLPVATNSFSFSADNSGFYIRWKDASNVQKIITLTPWVLV